MNISVLCFIFISNKQVPSFLPSFLPASCHSTTILSVLLSLSISPSHQHTVSPIFLLFRHSFITSSTTTNRKSLGALHTPAPLTHHILFSLCRGRNKPKLPLVRRISDMLKTTCPPTCPLVQVLVHFVGPK